MPVPQFSDEAKKWLAEYDWPGNVRELQNLMERAVLLSGGRLVEPAHFLLNGDSWPLFEDDFQTEAGGLSGLASGLGSGLASGLASVPLAGPNAGVGVEGASVAENAPFQALASNSSESGSVGHSGGQAFNAGVIPLHEMERIMIMRGLEQTAGNRTQAAELLGISVRTLRNKLSEYRGQGAEIA